MLRGQPCPVSELCSGRLAKRHSRGGVSGEPGPSGPAGDTRQRLPPGCPGAGSAARSRDGPACRTHLPPPRPRPRPLPVPTGHRHASAPHYAKGKAFSWARAGPRARFPRGLLSNCSEPTSMSLHLFSNDAFSGRAFVFPAGQQSTGWLRAPRPPRLRLGVSPSHGRHPRAAGLHV